MTQIYEPLSPSFKKLLDTITEYHHHQFLTLQDAERSKRSSKAPALNVDLLLRDLARQNLNGENLEALQEAARKDGVTFDPVRPYLSFRDLTTAMGSAGGFLKQTDVQESVDILRPWSVMARAGIQVEFGLVGDQAIPKVSAKSTPTWLLNEASEGTPSVPTLQEIVLTPKSVIGTLAYSRHFAKQANARRFAARELLRTAATAIDQAILNGPGIDGQPLGLISTPGVQTQAGAALNAGCATMKRKSAEANVTDEQISFLSTPAVRELLEGREKAAGGGKFVWDADKVADRPAHVTTDMPEDTMICGDFSLIYLGFWGAGLYLELNPFDQTGFKAGIIQARVLASCDIAVRSPGAFIVASSIT